MSIFEQLQQNREAGLQKLLEATEDSKDKYTDDRFWYPGVDKVGNGFAIIRFLPDPNAKQWVTYYEAQPGNGILRSLAPRLTISLIQ